MKAIYFHESFLGSFRESFRERKLLPRESLRGSFLGSFHGIEAPIAFIEASTRLWKPPPLPRKLPWKLSFHQLPPKMQTTQVDPPAERFGNPYRV